MFGRSKDEPDGHDDSAAQQNAEGGAVSRRRVEAVRFEPPRDLRAAMAGVLLDGTIGAREIAVMLVDLSKRGWYTMEQDKGRWAFVTARQLPPADAELLDAERLLLAAMFRPSPADTPGDDIRVQYVSMTSLTHRLQGHMNAIQSALGQQLVRDGLATRNPSEPGRLLGCRSPLLTAAGEAAREECAGYRLYLSRAEAGALLHDDAEGFVGPALPYAVAFDIVPRWAAVIGTSTVTGTSASASMLRDLQSNPLLVGVASASPTGFDLGTLMVLSVARNYGARFPGDAPQRRR